MPKRTDISSILIIGVGPVIIEKACDSDCSVTHEGHYMFKKFAGIIG